MLSQRERPIRGLVLSILCFGNLMIVLDATIVSVALPSIRADLAFSEASLAWVVNAYLLTFGGFLLLGGRLGDHRLVVSLASRFRGNDDSHLSARSCFLSVMRGIADRLREEHALLRAKAEGLV